MSSVQHVTKASSDDLLKKFAQVGSEKDLKKELQIIVKRRRRISIDGNCDSPSGNRRMSWTDRKSLLPVKKSKSGVMRRLGMGRSSRARAAFGAIEKTWRRTIEGASKVFVEKHYYNRHKRLINDPIY